MITLNPLTQAWPEDGRSAVPRMRRRVVFPAPLGPAIARIVPLSTSRLIPASALTPPG